MDAMDTYDVVIVGSGTAGQTAAFYLKEKGLRVALVEKSARPGGTCALAGCQPKKWFYEVAEAIDRTRHLSGKGIVTTAEGSWRSVFEQKNKNSRQESPKKTVKHLKDAGIAFLPGTATFIDEKTLSINKEKIQSRFFVLVTGARPMVLPIDGIEHVITSSEFLEMNYPAAEQRGINNS
jgi:glutathione reductase (NADPH)